MTARASSLLRALPLLGLAALLSRPATAAADSIRCAGGIVSEGDAGIDLLGKCGEPTLAERRVDDRWAVLAERRDGGKVSAGRRVGVVVEQWSYDFGPDSFVQVVTLENGRVTAVARGSYGYRREAAAKARARPRARCDAAVIRPGDLKLEVVSRCGEPALIDAWDEARGTIVTDGQGRRTIGEGGTVRVERWTYDLGRNQFVRFVRFENGRVVEVSTGSYGYAD